MHEQISVGSFKLSPWPDADGDMEIEMDDSTVCSTVTWLHRGRVLDLTKTLIKNFEFTEEDLNGSPN